LPPSLFVIHSGLWEQAKCQVAINDNIAIFKGRQDFWR
jgi:hypothetical protein